MQNKEKSLLKNCKACGKEVAKGIKRCPNCGKDQRNFFMKHKVLSFIIAVFILGGISGAMEDDAGIEDNPVVKVNEVENVNETSNESQEIDVVEKEVEDIPTEYKSALKKAKTYSDIMNMSKAGLYNQLTSEYGEKFTAEAAQYAIDNVDADWKENALKKAKTYQESMAMSPSAIYDQLVSEHGEKFTAEEAQYAVDNLE